MSDPNTDPAFSSAAIAAALAAVPGLAPAFVSAVEAQVAAAPQPSTGHASAALLYASAIANGASAASAGALVAALALSAGEVIDVNSLAFHDDVSAQAAAIMGASAAPAIVASLALLAPAPAVTPAAPEVHEVAHEPVAVPSFNDRLHALIADIAEDISKIEAEVADQAHAVEAKIAAVSDQVTQFVSGNPGVPLQAVHDAVAEAVAQHPSTFADVDLRELYRAARAGH